MPDSQLPSWPAKPGVTNRPEASFVVQGRSKWHFVRNGGFSYYLVDLDLSKALASLLTVNYLKAGRDQVPSKAFASMLAEYTLGWW